MVLCAVVFVIFLRTFVTFWTPDCRLTFERSHRILILVESPLSRFLRILIGLIYLLVYRLGQVVRLVLLAQVVRHHQGHLVQVRRRYSLLV